jgi:hypothetical protein
MSLTGVIEQVVPRVTISNTNLTADTSSRVKLEYAGKLKNELCLGHLFHFSSNLTNWFCHPTWLTMLKLRLD